MKGREKDEVKLAEVLEISVGEARRFLTKDIPPSHDTLLRAQQRLGISYRDWYECFAWPALDYFLGKDSKGKINYRLPEGIADWQNIAALDEGQVHKIISRGIKDSDLSKEEKVRRMRTVREVLTEERGFTDFVIRSLTRGTTIDPRLLFFWSRRAELEPIMGFGTQQN